MRCSKLFAFVMMCLLLALAIAATENHATSPEFSENEPAPHLAYQYPTFLAGSIYEQRTDGNKLLYRFQRRASRSGDKLNVKRDFTYPDGKLAAQEVAVYRGNEIEFYELKDLQTAGQGSITFERARNGSPATLDFQYLAERGAKPKFSRESWSGDTLVSDMVGHFLSARWEALVRGEKVKCRLAVIPRRETIGFTFRKTGESSWQGRGVITVRMDATSPLLAPLVDALLFTIDKEAPHHVLQYVGRTTPKIREGNKWKDLDALTVFDWDHAQR